MAADLDPGRHLRRQFTIVGVRRLWCGRKRNYVQPPAANDWGSGVQWTGRLGIATEHPWLLVVLTILAVLAGFGFWLLKSAQKREEQQRQEQFQRDMIANRAEYEDKLYQQGDPRGIHGRYMPPESLRDRDGTDGVFGPR